VDQDQNDERDEVGSGVVWHAELPDGRNIVGTAPDAVAALETINRLAVAAGA
jgi:hypothetical protein